VKVTIRQAKNITVKTVGHNLAKLKEGKPVFFNPVMLHSSPGIGKSAVVAQAADELKIGFIDVRLGMMEAADVSGIPYVSHAGNDLEEMKFSIPQWWPTEGEGILFFDEISNANIGVQHAAYRIILDRELPNGEKLPDGWQIVAAGNMKGDKTGAKDIAPALANRFGIHLEIDANKDEFVRYAHNNGIDSRVIGFLEWQGAALYRFDPAKNQNAFPTPRSWEKLSHLLEIDYNDLELTTVISGCIGEATASEFQGFLKYYSKLPNINDIMSGKLDYKVDKIDRGIVFALTSSIIAATLQNYDDAVKIKNLWKVVDQLNEDFIVLVYKSAKSIDDRKVLASLMKNTLSTWKRVSKQITDSDDD
jgi:hypothetical protein